MATDRKDDDDDDARESPVLGELLENLLEFLWRREL